MRTMDFVSITCIGSVSAGQGQYEQLSYKYCFKKDVENMNLSLKVKMVKIELLSSKILGKNAYTHCICRIILLFIKLRN